MIRKKCGAVLLSAAMAVSLLGVSGTAVFAEGQDTVEAAEELMITEGGSDETAVPSGAESAESKAEKIEAEKIEAGEIEEDSVVEEVDAAETEDAEEASREEEETDCSILAGDTYRNPGDWDGLPGWRYHIDCNDGGGFTSDGDYFEYKILEVTPVTDNWNKLIELNKQYENGDENAENWWWDINTLDFGSVTLKIKGQKESGATFTYTTKVNVVEDIYSIDYINTEEGRDYYQPGEEFIVTIDPAHHSVDESREGDLSKVTYNWYVAEESKPYVKSIAPLDGDPTKAKVVVGELPADQDGGEIVTWVEMLDENGAVLTRADWGVSIRHTYSELYPLMLDSRMTPGSSETVTVELRDYAETGSYETRKNIGFRWYYEPDAMEVLDAKGNCVGGRVGEYVESDHAMAGADGTCSFKIHRIKEWGAEFTLMAVEYDDQGNWNTISERRFGFEELRSDFWSDPHDVNDVFTDTDTLPAVFFDTHVIEGYEEWMDIDFTVGEESWGEWKSRLTEGKDYTVSKADGGINVTLTRSFLDSLEEYTDIRVLAQAYVKGAERTEENCLRKEDGWIHIRKARADYPFEEDRSMLTGWGGSVNGSFNVWVENSEYPDGRDFECRVTNVEIVSDKPENPANGAVIDDFHRDQDENDANNYWWNYRAANKGTAVLKVTYTDLDNTTKSYQFTIYVGNDVYDVWLNTSDGAWKALPGGTLELTANASHEYYGENGESHDDSDGLGYEWSIEEGGDFAVLTPDAKDPSRAVLKFNDLPEGRDGIGEDVRVGVKLLDEKGQDTGVYKSENYRVESEYFEIYPFTLNRDLELGGTLADQTFEVRKYEYGKSGYEVLDKTYDIKYQVDYDENAVAVTEKKSGKDVAVASGSELSGNTISITRLREWDPNLNVRAYWTAEYGNDERQIGYRFNDSNIDFYFDFDRDHGISIYDDQELTITPYMDGIGKLLDLPGSSIDFRVGYWAGEDNWVDFDKSLYSSDATSVTLYGDKMKAADIRHFDIQARLLVNGEEQIRDNWCWGDLQESCTSRGEAHKWLEGITPATLKEDGLYEKHCSACGEDIVTVIPKVGTIKLSKTSFTYTGKAQKPTVTVKDANGNKIAASNYTVTYAPGKKNKDKTCKNAGSYDVTVKFKGNYSGSKTLTYKIAQVNNSITKVTSSAKISLAKLKKAKQTFTIAATVKEKAKTTFKLTSVPAKAKKYISVAAKTGKVTVKKGLAKGTYKIKVKITADETTNYKQTAVTKTIKVIVK